MPNYRPKYPLEHIDAIATRYRSGETPRSIAPDYGVTDVTIKNWLRAAGIQLRTVQEAGALRRGLDKTKVNAQNAHHWSLKRPRTCTECNQVYVARSSRQRRCYDCIPDREARARFRRYGITEHDYKQLLETQKHQCALCDKPLSENNYTAIDHCHTTGKVRGILCRGCNMVLHYYERPGFNQRVHQYLGR